MDKQDEQKYEALLEMFNSEGWKLFQEEVKESLNSSIESAPEVCATSEQWQYRRGEIFKLRQIEGYEQYTRAVLQQLEEGEEWEDA